MESAQSRKMGGVVVWVYYGCKTVIHHAKRKLQLTDRRADMKTGTYI